LDEASHFEDDSYQEKYKGLLKSHLELEGKYVEAFSQIEKYQDQKRELEDRLVKLTSKLVETEEALIRASPLDAEGAEKRIKQYEFKINILENELRNSNEKLLEAENRLDELYPRLREAELQIAEYKTSLNQAKAKYQTHHTQYDEQMANMEKRLGDYEQDTQKLVTDLKRLEAAKENLEKNDVKREEYIRVLEEELEEVRTDLNKIKEKEKEARVTLKETTKLAEEAKENLRITTIEEEYEEEENPFYDQPASESQEEIKPTVPFSPSSTLIKQQQAAHIEWENELRIVQEEKAKAVSELERQISELKQLNDEYKDRLEMMQEQTQEEAFVKESASSDDVQKLDTDPTFLVADKRVLVRKLNDFHHMVTKLSTPPKTAREKRQSIHLEKKVKDAKRSIVEDVVMDGRALNQELEKVGVSLTLGSLTPLCSKSKRGSPEASAMKPKRLSLVRKSVGMSGSPSPREDRSATLSERSEGMLPMAVHSIETQTDLSGIEKKLDFVSHISSENVEAHTDKPAESERPKRSEMAIQCDSEPTQSTEVDVQTDVVQFHELGVQAVVSFQHTCMQTDEAKEAGMKEKDAIVFGDVAVQCDAMAPETVEIEVQTDAAESCAIQVQTEAPKMSEIEIQTDSVHLEDQSVQAAPSVTHLEVQTDPIACVPEDVFQSLLTSEEKLTKKVKSLEQDKSKLHSGISLLNDRLKEFTVNLKELITGNTLVDVEKLFFETYGLNESDFGIKSLRKQLMAFGATEDMENTMTSEFVVSLEMIETFKCYLVQLNEVATAPGILYFLCHSRTLLICL
jgi:chromosome segregation ATPase